jgi:hypothetical protein
LVGVALRPEGGVTARFSDSVDLAFDNQQQADEFVRKPYHYENQFSLASGQYTFRISIGAAGNTFGSVEAPLNIAPWAASEFALGSIALSREIYSADSASASEVPLLEGRSSLAVNGKRFVPSGSDRFDRAGPIYFYTEIYDPSLVNPSPSVHVIQYRILDGKTGEVKADSGLGNIESFVHAGSPVIPFALSLPLAQLPPGAYRLEVTASRTAGPERPRARWISN